MRALEQPLLAVQQLESGIRTLRYRPLLPEDFQPLKVSSGDKQVHLQMQQTSMHCCCSPAASCTCLAAVHYLVRITIVNVASRICCPASLIPAASEAVLLLVSLAMTAS
jgi:hypothetical protein